MRFSPRRRRFLAGGLVLMFCGALALAFFGDRPGRVLLAPMIGLDVCLWPSGKAARAGAADPQLAQACSGPAGSAAALVESTLSALQPAGASHSGYELGYTLNVPLLKLFVERDGDWVIDKESLGRVVRTLRDTDRPVILYLFSTHFGQDAPIEAALAGDPANLGWTAQGPLPNDTFYGAAIYNWSLAGPRTAITARRVQAAQAVLREVCKLEPRHVARIRGITLLGELHHLFPKYERDMGFVPPYLVSDYSETSRTEFRRFLQRRFGTIESLNAAVGTRWTAFEQIEPPSLDIRTAARGDFAQHVDSFAHGSLPVSGWAFLQPRAADSPPLMVRIYLDGDLAARVPVSMGRQDVLQALPELGTTDPGWRFDLDFRNLAKGLHRIDVLLENAPDDLIHLAAREIAILDRDRQAGRPVPRKQLPASRTADASLKASVDMPADGSSYFYNPLVTYWHEFRARQVADYLQSFERALQAPCVASTPRYTHQILPFTHPAWDQTKFAVDASLRKLEGIGLGVSLYGEPTYGTSFHSWLDASAQHEQYGVTEFHPLKGMDTTALDRMLREHRRHGAQFVSFFLEPRWKGGLVPRSHNPFSFDPDNPRFGSQQLYESVREMLRAGAG